MKAFLNILLYMCGTHLDSYVDILEWIAKYMLCPVEPSRMRILTLHPGIEI